ncbi:MAG: 30S ribosome-binding factor RbfA [Deltaproteobacteria bacterium]|nr:30S ribosome-binding factor RbfA [Deltaproteobacteria bacterium]
MSRGKKKPSRSGGGRPVQVGELVRQTLSEVLHEGRIKDPRLDKASLVTLTGVDMSPDLKMARCFVSIFPDDAVTVADVLEGLGSASNEMKRILSARTGLRFTPQLRFDYDGSIANGARIEALLRDVADHDRGVSEPEQNAEPDQIPGPAERRDSGPGEP